jgi:hypothetical protein
MPGVALESEAAIDNDAVAAPKETPGFEELAAHALDKAGIDPQVPLWAAQLSRDDDQEPAPPLGPAIVDTNEDELV